MQKNAIFIFQKINFLNYTFHTRIPVKFVFRFSLNLKNEKPKLLKQN